MNALPLGLANKYITESWYDYSELKIGKLCNKELLDKDERSNKIAPLLHKC